MVKKNKDFSWIFQFKQNFIKYKQNKSFKMSVLNLLLTFLRDSFFFMLILINFKRSCL